MTASVLLLLPHVVQLLQQSFCSFLDLTVPEGLINNIVVDNDDRSQYGRGRQTNHRTAPFC